MYKRQGDCGGSATEDDCGVCNGDGPEENFDCDGNCIADVDCAGVCGGSSAYDECGVCDGDGLSCATASLSLGSFDPSGTLEVLYDFGGPLSGFQFVISGLNLTGASGGAAGDADFTVQSGDGNGNGNFYTVLGFSFNGDQIPAGTGVLTVLEFDDIISSETVLSLGSGALTGENGFEYDATVADSIDHGLPDCAGDYYGDSIVDECGVCNGGGIADGTCDCDGNVADCAGDCGGSSVEDDCGVCGGDGPEENFDCNGNCIDDVDLSRIHISAPT